MGEQLKKVGYIKPYGQSSKKEKVSSFGSLGFVDTINHVDVVSKVNIVNPTASKSCSKSN